jgi:multimeric flavodoxin WrbA/putative sterol carrier protein
MKELIGALYKDTELPEKSMLFDLIKDLIDSFDPQKAEGFNGIFQFEIKCDDELVWFLIEVKDKKLIVELEKKVDRAYLEIKCNFETFCQITLGKFNPLVFILNGKIKLSKGLLSLLRFAKLDSLLSNRKVTLKLPTTIKHAKNWIEPKKILLVNGSPRLNGSTKLMLNWFHEGLPAEITDVIDISSLNISKCLNCYKCWTDHPGRCVLNDDAKIFRQKIDEADLIVFFVPLSYATMPSDMKKAFERLFPETTPFFYNNREWNATAHPLHPNKKSQSFLQFLVWGFPEMKHGRILEDNFIEWTLHSHKNYLGSIKRPGINMILGDPRLQFERRKIKKAIIEIAKSIHKTGKIPPKSKVVVENLDYYSTKDFNFFATNYWLKRFKTDYWN